MTKGEIHYQVAAALALKEGKEEAYSLLNYLAKSDKETFQTALEHLNTSPPEQLSVDMDHRLKAWHAQESFSGIAEIHPAWLLEALKRESPRVIGVILRHLPSKHVRYLLEHLPQRTVVHLPKLIEAFYVPTDLLSVIRRRFERHFVPMRISHQIDQFAFHHLYYLKMEDLERLFYDLGLTELALSLVGASRKILKTLLNRFGVKEAKEILNRIKNLSEEKQWLLRDAKYSVLELGGKEVGVAPFLKELGLQVLAKAFTPADSFFFESLKQKLAPESAYLLKRYLEEQLSHFTPDKAFKRKTSVLDHIKRLSEEGKIDTLWSGYFKQEAA